MIYICIPALNEAPTIGVLLWKIRKVMAEFPRDYHLLVLDDGSTDDTREVLEPYAEVLPLTVLRNDRTQGYAASLERLLREAVARSTHPKRDAAVVLQADFSESPDDLPALIRKMEGGADVVGTEVVEVEGETTRPWRWSRKGLPWLLRSRALPREARDPLSGFRAYRISVLKRALADREGEPLVTASGWAANVQLLLAVAPHVRRADAAEVRLRLTRRERPTRFEAWPLVRAVWDVARRAPRWRPEAPALPAAPQPAPAEAPASSDAPARAPSAGAAPGASGDESPEQQQRPPRRRSRGRRGPRPGGGEGAPPPSES